MTHEEFDRAIKLENNNFYAFALTPLHAVGINVIISYLEDNGRKLKGYIFIRSHGITGKTIDSNSFSYASKELKIENYDYGVSSKSIFEALREKKSLLQASREIPENEVYLVWTDIENEITENINKYVSIHKFIFIRIDDGEGSYLPMFRRFYGKGMIGKYNSTIIEKCKNYFAASIKTTFYSLICHNLKNRERYVEATIFKNSKSNIISRNELFADRYVEVFKGIKAPSSYFDSKSSKGICLINTQCLLENSLTDGISDFQIIKEVCSKLCTKGYRIIIKPHPREKSIEKYEELHATVIKDNSIPQEAMIANAVEKPKFILGFNSSSLLNAYGLFEIQVISLANMLKDKNGVSKKYKKDLKKYIKRYKDYFAFPKEFDDFDRLLW